MGTDTQPNQELISSLRVASIANFKATTDIGKNHKSFAHAMEDLGLWEWHENQVMVQAYLEQSVLDLNNYLHMLPISKRPALPITDPFTWTRGKHG